MSIACSVTACERVQDTDLMAVMQAADLDGNGAIDYEEFIVSTVNLARLNKKVSLLARQLLHLQQLSLPLASHGRPCWLPLCQAG